MYRLQHAQTSGKQRAPPPATARASGSTPRGGLCAEPGAPPCRPGRRVAAHRGTVSLTPAGSGARARRERASPRRRRPGPAGPGTAPSPRRRARIATPSLFLPPSLPPTRSGSGLPPAVRPPARPVAPSGRRPGPLRPCSRRAPRRGRSHRAPARRPDRRRRGLGRRRPQHVPRPPARYSERHDPAQSAAIDPLPRTLPASATAAEIPTPSVHKNQPNESFLRRPRPPR